MGIGSVGHRRMLLEAIAALNATPGLRQAATTSASTKTVAALVIEVGMGDPRHHAGRHHFRIEKGLELRHTHTPRRRRSL